MTTNLELLLGPHPEKMEKTAPQMPFSDLLIGFVSAFSDRILRDPGLRRFKDLVALGFWMRPAHLNQLKEQFQQNHSPRVRIPRGRVFHLAPSNVDTLFAYSLLLSLVLGNENVVRLSQKNNPVQDQIIVILKSLLQQGEFADLSGCLSVVRYDHDDHITTQLSAKCDCRVIWGGDATVNLISTLPLPPTATEIKFANKWSFALIDAPFLMEMPPGNLEAAATHFLNDSYWYGQAACSSPRMLFWRGNAEVISIAKKRFWSEVEKRLATFDHRLQAIDFVNKLNVCCQIATLADCRIEATNNNLISRISLQTPNVDILPLHCGAGLFYEINVNDLEALLPLLSRQIQTVTTLGVSRDELVNLAMGAPCGIDRIVPFGRALEFDVYWDGYNLFEEWTRGIYISVY